jgi:hypothetical protein
VQTFVTQELVITPQQAGKSPNEGRMSLVTRIHKVSSELGCYAVAAGLLSLTDNARVIGYHQMSCCRSSAKTWT